MPPPKEIPGFYYDAEKNRYFRIKAPIPGSSLSSAKVGPKKSTPRSAQVGPKKSTPRSAQERSSCRKFMKRTSKLLHARELNGNIINSHKWKCNFKEEFQKIRASQPVVWKYQGTDRIGISALEQININVDTIEGVTRTDVLLSGNLDGSLRFFEVRKEQISDVTWMPDCVRHYAKGKTYEHDEVPAPLVINYGGLIEKTSRISCIRLGPKFSSHGDEEGLVNVRHVLFTHLGSETSGGSVHIMDLADPLHLGVVSPIQEVASFKCTVWTAEYDYTRPRAVIGTNIGAASVDLETGQASWILHCKSDVFAQQIFNSGNTVLCGLRNGAIVTIDFRERRKRLSSRLHTHRIPYTPLDKEAGSSNKEWFKLTGDIYPSHTTRMPSSISCLVSLQFDDQYFLASSMDGSVSLYDHRLLQRGAVQSYEGHVNSHTRLLLGVDPDERFVMSGGEDCYLRLWSIKSGELLFEDKFSDAVLSTVCFRKYNYADYGFEPELESKYMKDYPLGAWLASDGGLYYMTWFSI